MVFKEMKRGVFFTLPIFIFSKVINKEAKFTTVHIRIANP